MTQRELAQLEHLLQKYREDHTWTVPGSKRDHGRDAYRYRADAVLSDLRLLRHHGTFYSRPEFEVSPDNSIRRR